MCRLQAWRKGGNPASRPKGLPAPLKLRELAMNSTSGSGAVMSIAGDLRAGPSPRTSRSSETSSLNSASSTRTKCLPTRPASRCPLPRFCSAATTRRCGWCTPNKGVFLDGHDTVAQREGGDPIPAGPVSSKLRQCWIVKSPFAAYSIGGRISVRPSILVRRSLETVPNTKCLTSFQGVLECP